MLLLLLLELALLGEAAAGGVLVLLAQSDPLVKEVADALRLGVNGGVARLIPLVGCGGWDQGAGHPEAADLARDAEEVLDGFDLF